jgi:outer membrane protein assembly factor BamB
MKHFVLFALACMLLSLPLQAATVGWLGDGTATYPDATPPIEWSSSKNVIWKAPLDRAYSSPVVVGKSVIVASEPNTVSCIDITTGKPIWSTPTQATDLPKDQQPKVSSHAGEGGNVAATPVCDDERVYEVFALGFVAAFDLKTGTRLWTQAMEAPLPGDGRSCSPVRVADVVIVHLSQLYALDAKTGEIRWKKDDVQEGYGTPRVSKIGADDVVFLPKGAVVRVSDGKVLTTLDASLMYNSPCIAEKRICYVGSDVTLFDIPDKLTDPLKLNQYWADSTEGPEGYPTALYHDGLLYTLSNTGMLSIFDVKAKTKTQKQLELEEPVYQSPVRAGKYIFVGNNKGKTLVLEPGKDAKVLKANELDSSPGATPAFSGKFIFIRTMDALYCIGEK